MVKEEGRGKEGAGDECELPDEVLLEHVLVVDVVVKVQPAARHQGLEYVCLHLIAVYEPVVVEIGVDELVTGHVRVPV